MLPYIDISTGPSSRRCWLARAASTIRGSEALVDTVETDSFRAALGHIACSYHGGQVVPE
jgi:hypothetical protein